MPFPVPGRLAETLRRSTVRIQFESKQASGNGSGVVIGPETVITNAHVIVDARPEVESWEGARLHGSVRKINRRRDLALLHVPKLAAPNLSLGDSDRLQPGQAVIAVGNPLGFTGAVSSGIVHSVGSHAVGLAGKRGVLSMSWVRSDLRLAPGNSGGPLTDFQGQLMGINTMIAAGGIAFAVPSRAVQIFLRTGERGSVGIVLRPVTWGRHTPGLLILELVSKGAAEAASLLPGDILVASAGRKLATPEDLDWAIDQASDSLLQLEFVRGGQLPLRHVAVRLMRQPVESAA